MAERKIFNFESAILVDKTLEEEGHHPDKFGKTSNKFIWATCRFCGEPSRLRKGQFIRNGSACHKECRLKEQSISGSPFKDKSVKEKARQTNLARYGSEHANQNKEVAKRISEGRRKAQSKIVNTNLERYGVENPFQSEEIKKRIREANLSKYGVTHPMQNSDVQEKTKSTLKEKYDVKNIRLHEPFKKTAMATRSQQIEDDVDGRYVLINILRSEAFWKELSKPNISLSDVCQTFNLPYQSAASTLSRDEFKEKFQSTYSYPKQQQQNAIKEFIAEHGIPVVFNDRKTIGYELDVFVPDKKFAIEFNGSYWHSEACLPVVVAKKKHIVKTKLCRENGIRLFHLFEHTWQNRRSQVLNFIRSILGLNEHRINARECVVDTSKCPGFIESTHIQGSITRVVKYFNLIHDSRVVASMTASSHHRQNTSDSTIVLSRLSFADSVTVRGGASKLFSAFKKWSKEQGYRQILSWSDNCWTEGNIYGTLGFELDVEYPPDYFYWDVKNKKYVSKQSQQKKKTGCPYGLTEREWCIQRGLYRIWDCGKKKWMYNL